MQKLKHLAEEHGFRVVHHHNEANIIASIGGDGTFLQAVRKTNFRDDCLYVGVAKRGKLICMRILIYMIPIK